MKIAHVVAAFYPYLSGTGSVCFNNAIHLAQRGHDVSIYTSAYPPGEYDYPAELSVHRLPIVFRVGNAPLLPGLAGIKDVDLIHLHYPFVFGQEIIYLKSLLGRIPYVITYHQDLILDGMMGRLVELHHQVLGKNILKTATRLYVTSTDYGLSSKISPLVQRIADRVDEVPNGVDTSRFTPDIDGKPTRAQYNIPADAPVILFVGGLDTPHYFKGVEVLIEAFAGLGSQEAYLMIVGDGDLRPRYEAKAAELNVSNRVVFCGRVSDEDLPAHYAACDLFTLPSITMGEAFGIVLLEAMSTGKPTIASKLPGVRSVVADGVDGLHTTPNSVEDLIEKLTHLIGDPALRQQMGAAGREKVMQKYEWSQIAGVLEASYQKVIEATS